MKYDTTQVDQPSSLATPSIGRTLAGRSQKHIISRSEEESDAELQHSAESLRKSMLMFLFICTVMWPTYSLKER